MAKMIVEFEFNRPPSSQAEREAKDAIQDFRETLQHLGRVTRADLLQGQPETPAPPPEPEPKQ